LLEHDFISLFHIKAGNGAKKFSAAGKKLYFLSWTVCGKAH
jgi:hypothetical protein